MKKKKQKEDSVNPFDFLKSINDTKEDLLKKEEYSISDYNPYLMNKGLSYYYDTVLFANVMNRNSHLDPDLQYYYYLYSIPRRKRFSQWYKMEENDDVKLVQEYYNYSRQKALEVLKLLTMEQLKFIKNNLDKGGLEKE